MQTKIKNTNTSGENIFILPVMLSSVCYQLLVNKRNNREMGAEIVAKYQPKAKAMFAQHCKSTIAI